MTRDLCLAVTRTGCAGNEMRRSGEVKRAETFCGALSGSAKGYIISESIPRMEKLASFSSCRGHLLRNLSRYECCAAPSLPRVSHLCRIG